MAAQIVNAYEKHICAYKCNNAVSYAQSWSDHDPYVIDINLGNSAPSALEMVQIEPQARKEIRHGQIIIIRGGVEYTITGQRID